MHANLGQAKDDERPPHPEHAALDAEAEDDEGFPTIFKQAMQAKHGDDDDEEEEDEMCSPRTECASLASTVYYDSEGFPVMKSGSNVSMKSHSTATLDGMGGVQLLEGDWDTQAEPGDGDAEMAPVSPSSRKRRTEVLAGVPPQPRGRPKKAASKAAPKASPKASKADRFMQTPKPKKNGLKTPTPKSHGKAKAIPCDGVLSRVCCCISEKPQPRAELTGYIPQPSGELKRVHIFTLTLKGWGQNYAEDAKALKEIILEKSLTKSQALDARDGLKA